MITRFQDQLIDSARHKRFLTPYTASLSYLPGENLFLQFTGAIVQNGEKVVCQFYKVQKSFVSFIYWLLWSSDIYYLLTYLQFIFCIWFLELHSPKEQ